MPSALQPVQYLGAAMVLSKYMRTTATQNGLGLSTAINKTTSQQCAMI